MLKYIIYCRKSTDEKDKQVLSIQAQIEELKEYAQREKLEVIQVKTEAKTAKIPGREQFAYVLKLIESGVADGILSWHPDRLARNSIDGGKIIYLLDTGHLKDLKFPSFWFDNTPQGKFMLSIAFGQSKYYVDNLSENVKRGLRQKIRNGVFPGKAPVGYKNNLITRSIDLDLDKAKFVKKACEMFSQGGYSFSSISKFLFKNGVTRGEGKPLKISRVKNMLTSRFYTGVFIYNGEYFKGSHKPLISIDLFNKVQKQVERIEKPRYKGHNFPFVGVARCGECGAAITGEQHVKKYKNGTIQTFFYYRCTKKMKPCTQKYVSYSEFDKQLRNIVLDVALPKSWGKDWFEWMERDAEIEKQKANKLILNLKLKKEEFDKKLNILLDSFLDGVIDQDTYKLKKNELFEEKLKIEEQIAKIKSKGTSWLEPMKEFTKRALEIEKIASAKNNPDELRSVGKTIGSNFFLKDQKLSVRLNEPFVMLCAGGGAQSPEVFPSPISQKVPPGRIELPSPP